MKEVSAMRFIEYVCGLLISLVTLPVFFIGALFGVKSFKNYLRIRRM